MKKTGRRLWFAIVLMCAAVILPSLLFIGCAGKSGWKAFAADDGFYAFYVKAGTGGNSFAAAVNIIGEKYHVGEIYCAYKEKYSEIKSVSIKRADIEGVEIKADIPVFKTAVIESLGDNVTYITVYSAPPGFNYSPEDAEYVCETVFASGRKVKMTFSIAAFKDAYSALSAV